MLGLTDDQTAAFVADGSSLVDSYLRMEDPSAIREIGLELRLEAPPATSCAASSTAWSSTTKVTSSSSTTRPARSPSVKYEQSRLSGVHFYLPSCASPCSGSVPRRSSLMYLRTGETITATPSAQSVKFITTHHRGVEGRREGVHQRVVPTAPGRAVLVVCVPAVVPAFGGNPSWPRSKRRCASSTPRHEHHRVRRVGEMVCWSTSAATPRSTP